MIIITVSTRMAAATATEFPTAAVFSAVVGAEKGCRGGGRRKGPC